MLRVDYQKWDQNVDDLRLFAIEAPHPRTRERFAALYDVAQGINATQVARQLTREDETVHRWVHTYNSRGPLALIFKRPGGRPPFARRSRPRFRTNWTKPSDKLPSPVPLASSRR
jgi:hypothetical protein